MSYIKRCSNCGETFKFVKSDSNYKFKYTHKSNTCPYTFEIYNNTKVKCLKISSKIFE